MRSLTPRSLKYLAASAFLCWQTCVFLIFQAPHSESFDRARALFEPYAKPLRIDADWRLFAPEPHLGGLLRYRIEGFRGPGPERTLEELSNFGRPGISRFFSMLVVTLDAEPGQRARLLRSQALAICRRNRDIHPRSVTLTVSRQLAMPPLYSLLGMRSMSAAFTRQEPAERTECPP